MLLITLLSQKTYERKWICVSHLTWQIPFINFLFIQKNLIVVDQYGTARGQLKEATISENLISWRKAHWPFFCNNSINKKKIENYCSMTSIHQTGPRVLILSLSQLGLHMDIWANTYCTAKTMQVPNSRCAAAKKKKRKNHEREQSRVCH